MQDHNGNIVIYKGQTWWNGTDHTDTLVGRDGIKLVIRQPDGVEYLTSSEGYAYIDHERAI